MQTVGTGAEVLQTLVDLQRFVTKAATRDRIQGDAGAGLTVIEAQLLRAIAAAGSTRVSDLAVQQGVDKSTITPQVRRLGVRGLVGRAPDPSDGRSVRLSVTAAGQAVLDGIDRNGAEYLDAILGGWSAVDRDTFCALFRRFTEDLRKA
jgi:DNA-binding MarR family transcriptional regulator